MRFETPTLTLLVTATLVGCSGAGREEDLNTPDDPSCEAEPVMRSTPSGVEFVRTPDSCFDGLTDWPYAPRYAEIDGLRQAYVDEGDPNGPVVLSSSRPSMMDVHLCCPPTETSALG